MFLSFFVIRLFLFTMFLVVTYCILSCKEVNQGQVHKLPNRYYRIKPCYRMNNTVMYRTKLPSLIRCLNFAAEKKGLAVNYSPRQNQRYYDEDEDGLNFMNCEVLGCPDLNNLTSLVNDSRYDYYSLYGNTEALINCSCIPYTGVFRLYSEAAITNYTNARNFCSEYDSRLAHIVNEQRTQGIAQVLSARRSPWREATFVLPWDTVAYVGLDDREKEGDFVTEWGEPLECFKYRAWAPGHPRKNRKKDDCVVIDDKQTWRAVHCGKKLPFFCELEPRPPYWTEYKEFANNSCSDLTNRTMRRKCKKIKKAFKKAQRRVNYEKEKEYDDDRCEEY